jgi:YYY domain-containing protein
MVELFQMWAMVELLGLICLPLTITVFHNLPDRGWAFSKTIGLALLAFCVWLPLMYVQALPFSQLFIAGVLIILLAFSIVGFIRMRHTLVELIRANIFYIVACEVVFLGMVFLLGWIRSYGPDIRSFEMFMDEGFLAAIMRSPHFPPNDMWLSGYPINYYYYAHFTIATLAKLLGQPPSVAFNTGICIFFGLTAVNLFGVTCNIVSWARFLRKRNVASGAYGRRMWSTFLRRREPAAVNQNNDVASDSTITIEDLPSADASASQNNDVQADRPDIVLPPLVSAIPYGLLTILIGEVLGNLASTQQWWKQHDNLPPLYWFYTTRIIDKTINEFPAFSFLLSCFHAHVLTFAFTILAIALAFNLFLEYGRDGKGKGLHVFGSGWRLPLTLGITAMILGGLFAMNGWDFPTYLAIALICIGFQQWLAYQSRFSLELVLDVFTIGAALTALSFFLYAPFYLNFVSPSQGIGIVSSADRSPIRDEALIYGMFAFIFISLLFVNLLRPRLSAQAPAGKIPLAPGPNVLSQQASPSRPGQLGKNAINYVQVSQDDMLIGSGSRSSTASGSHRAVPVHQPVISTSQAMLHQSEDENKSVPPEAGHVMDEPLEGEANPPDMVEVPLTGALSPIPPGDIQPSGTHSSRPDWLDMRIISVVLVLGVSLLAFAIVKNGATLVVAFTLAVLGLALALYYVHDRPRAFTLLLGSAAFGLVALTELVFLKDVFAGSYPRMNTVFKLYFQAWALLSVTSGVGLYFVLDNFRPATTTIGLHRWVRRGSQALWSVVLLLLLLAGLVYPVVGSYQRTNHFMHRTNSLDGLTYMQSYDPSDYAAIQWLNSHIQGDPVIVEAFGPQGGDYSDYGRISAFTGLPTLMGWAGHEYQWRVNWLNKDYNAADFYRRGSDINTIYTDPHPDVVLALMDRYNAQYIYVGPLEEETYPRVDLHRFSFFMQTVYSANGVTIYEGPQRP